MNIESKLNYTVVKRNYVSIIYYLAYYCPALLVVCSWLRKAAKD